MEGEKKEKKEVKRDKKEELDEMAERFAKKFKEATGLDKLLNRSEYPKVLEEKAKKDSRLAKILVGGVEKNKKDLTSNEKALLWFGAILRDDKKMQKALSEGTAADGGYLFPDEFRAELIKEIEAQPRMRSLVRVLPMKRDVMNIPGLASGPQVYWTEENAVKSTTTLHFTEHTLTAHKIAAILYASDELIEDSTEIDVLSIVRSTFAEKIGDFEDQYIIQGSGTNQITGLNNCSIPTVTCSGNLDFNDIINLIYNLPSQYRSGASFLVHNTNIAELRKITDSNGRYLWQEPLSQGQPATIYGYPVYEMNHLSESQIYFGNFKLGYILGDRKRMTVETTRTSETAWTRDQVSIRIVERIAGNCVLTNAMRELVSIP